MTTDAADTPAQAEQHTARWSPAGLSRRSVLTFRRAIMLTLALISYAAILYMVGLLLGDGGTGGAFWSGWTGLDIGIALCIALSAPWTVLGFWNALIGFLLHAMGAGRPAWAAALERDGGPDALDPRDAPPLSSRVALLMTLRNEDPARAMARLLAIRASVDATGEGSAFDLFVLSDSDAPDVVAEEERLFAQLEPRLAGAGAASYRRRERNHGFKAGNIQDFLDAHGDDYAFFAPLDADSAMSGAALLSFARMMEARPRLGLLQSLAVGAPNSSGFGRLFQFGMRHGMRSFTAGSAWWQGDCGPFWGHNALVRTAPFRRACKLPELPGAPPLGGPILSHDQVEAVLMRRAGYEVRVAPIEIDSWEENPPTLLDFIRREERWCTGNMQYWTLLGTPGLRPVSRLQLWQAILMYVASPAWMLMTLLATVKPFEADAAAFNLSLGVALFATMFMLSIAPKLAGAAAVLATRGGLAAYGGGLRFGAGFLLELLFSMLIAPVVAFRLTVLQIGLVFGRRIKWSGQPRDAYRLSWGDAAAGLWGATLFGLTLTGLLLISAPGALPFAAPLLMGLCLSIPIAVGTAAPSFGRWLSRTGLAAIPEDLTPHPLLQAVARHERALDAVAREEQAERMPKGSTPQAA